VQNGRRAKFWTSSWLDGMSPAAMFPALFRQRKRKNRSVAVENDNRIRDIMQNISAELFVDYVMLWILVDDVALDLTQQEEDTITWTRKASEEYSAKSAYRMQFYGNVESTYPAKVWQVWAPSRCKFFIWLMLQNKVWTADRLLLKE
jgi:hypothetical protein